MKYLDIEAEKERWEHPYRIQVTKPLRKRKIGSIIEALHSQGVNCAVESRGNRFVLWREPEQEWDVDDASLEWIQEWTSHKPPPPEALIEEYQVNTKNGVEENMSVGENRRRRDEAIRTEFAYLKKQGFKSGHIYRALAEKFYLSPLRIRDIVTLTREKLPKTAE